MPRRNDGRQHQYNNLNMPAFAAPIVVTGSTSRQLERLDLKGPHFSESWLQSHLFKHPESLPLREIEPNLGPVVPLCMELKSLVGFMDIVYVTPTGQIVLVETKLWRNAEARREVVAQILDYAQSLTSWRYEDLAREVAKATKRGPEYLLESVRERHPDVHEAAFVDAINHNLRTGDFLLLIVGDGIRTGTESLVSFLDSYGTMRFSLGLIEVAAFQLDDSVILHPRVLAKTEIFRRRLVIPVDGNGRELPVRLDGDEVQEAAPLALKGSPAIAANASVASTVSPERLEYEQQWIPAFWRDFMDRLKLDDRQQPVPIRTPRSTNATFPMPPNASANWVNTYLARTLDSAGVALSFSSQYERRRDVYDVLTSERDEIEKEIGAKLSWIDNGGSLRIEWQTKMGDWRSEEVRSRLLDVLLDYTNRFVNTLRPRIEAILRDFEQAI